MPFAPITLFLAPTAYQARRAAWELARKTATPLDPPLVFCDSSSAQLWRELARENNQKAQTAPRLLRADEFFARFHAANARRRSLNGADRLWVLSQVARSVAPQLETLEKPAQNRDFLAGFADWIAQLRRANLAQFPAAAPDAVELNILLRAYETRLESLNAFDFEAASALFPLSAARNQAFSWPQTLVVDDLLDPSPALQIGLKSLLERAQNVAATLVCPGGIEAENSALSGALHFWHDCGAKITRIFDPTPQTRVAARFLGAETEVAAPQTVHLTPAHTPWDEMNRIAARIRREVENGSRADDFALAVGDLRAYEAAARHAFAAHGVPLDWPFEAPLRQSPLVRALLRAASACRGAWNVHELHDLFGDGTLQLRLESQVFSPKRLRAAALAARHPDVADLEATRAAFESKIKQFTAHPKNDEAPRRAAIEAAIVSGDLEIVAHFQEMCGGLSGQLTARAWQSRLLELIQTLAGHWLDGEDETARVACGILERFQAAIECVVERARDLGGDDEAEMRRGSDWLSWLEWEIERPARRDSAGGARVGSASSPPSARRATYFCGLSEGIWPNSPNVGPLGARGREFSRILRAHQAAPIARASHVLARALNEEGAVSLSFPNHLAGKETSPSPLVDDLEAAFPDASWPQLADDENATRRAYLRSWNRVLETAPDALVPTENLHFETLFQLRTQRRDAQKVGIYDGVLGERGAVLMEKWAATQHSDALSGSALELFARCPIRYFFERVLGLGGEDQPDDDLDARAAGTLVHEITRRFFESFTVPLQSENFDAALQLLAEIARDECAKLPIRPILREAEWHRLLGADGQSGPLNRWLKLETAAGEGVWSVAMRPLSHSQISLEGVQNGLEHRFKIEISGQTIVGTIDRLDISAGGEQIAVLDYKTGGIAGLPSWNRGDGGLHFQLAIYALAARNLTRSQTTPPRLAMAYLSLRSAKIARGIGQNGTFKGRNGQQLSDENFDDWLGDVSARVGQIADLRRAGSFHISLQSAKDAKCDHCDSRSLCGQNFEVQKARFDGLQGAENVYLPAIWEWK